MLIFSRDNCYNAIRYPCFYVDVTLFLSRKWRMKRGPLFEILISVTLERSMRCTKPRWRPGETWAKKRSWYSLTFFFLVHKTCVTSLVFGESQCGWLVWMVWSFVLKVFKEANQKIVDEYGYCMLDHHKERIGNFKIEPPGLFRGRGEHPKQGMLKKRIQPEDVIINCSK